MIYTEVFFYFNKNFSWFLQTPWKWWMFLYNEESNQPTRSSDNKKLYKNIVRHTTCTTDLNLTWYIPPMETQFHVILASHGEPDVSKRLVSQRHQNLMSLMKNWGHNRSWKKLTLYFLAGARHRKPLQNEKISGWKAGMSFAMSQQSHRGHWWRFCWVNMHILAWIFA